MLENFDPNKGLVKVYWSDIRLHIKKIEPNFTKIVDQLSPDKTFPLYLAYYPYGAFDADTVSTLLPDNKGGYYRITSPHASKDIVTQLGYSKNNTPFSMVLSKQFESYVDLPSQSITIPFMIYTAGKMFPFTRILPKYNNRVYSPNGLLTSTAGARSVFMLPNIGCATNHINLHRDLNVQERPPKYLYDHWSVFKGIVNSEVINSDWRACVMYFSEKWVQKIHNDYAWHSLKQYLHMTAWQQFEYEVNRIHYDMIYSIIQQNRNLKPNPYLTDTAKHLFATVIGAVPGYTPAENDNAIPIKIIQKVYVESYNLKKYLPTIMQPTYYNFEKDSSTIYYSLQHPSTHVFSPKSRQVSSTLFEMRELEHIVKVFTYELSKEDSMCVDTIIGKAAKKVKFKYFHTKTDRHKVILPSAEIANLDTRFSKENCEYKNPTAVFAGDAPFLRGCISIKA